MNSLSMLRVFLKHVGFDRSKSSESSSVLTLGKSDNSGLWNSHTLFEFEIILVI